MVEWSKGAAELIDFVKSTNFACNEEDEDEALRTALAMLHARGVRARADPVSAGVKFGPWLGAAMDEFQSRYNRAESAVKRTKFFGLKAEFERWSNHFGYMKSLSEEFLAKNDLGVGERELLEILRRGIEADERLYKETAGE